MLESEIRLQGFNQPIVLRERMGRAGAGAAGHSRAYPRRWWSACDGTENGGSRRRPTCGTGRSKISPPPPTTTLKIAQGWSRRAGTAGNKGRDFNPGDHVTIRARWISRYRGGEAVHRRHTFRVKGIPDDSAARQRLHPGRQGGSSC